MIFIYLCYLKNIRYTRIYIYVDRYYWQKAKVNFGLYSSNWTAMDLKYKKTLLFAMNMNSAHRRVMKVTPKSIVNLEMFSNVSFHIN